MDYSKVFELLNQDTEKERNEKAEKAVHDNLYNKGFRDGLAVLEKVRAEIEQYQSDYDVHGTEYDRTAWKAFNRCLQIIDKYTAGSEPQESEVDDGECK